MKKIVIQPLDEKQKLLLQALKIKNEFIKMGFTKRKVFVEVVQEALPDYRSYKSTQYLIDFWLSRVKDEKLNSRLLQLIIHLKSSQL